MRQTGSHERSYHDRHCLQHDASSMEALPLYAVFAMQVFLDIRHLLWDDAIRPFEQMQATGKRVVDTLNSYFAFSRGRSADVWTPEHDELLQHLRTFADAWTQKDNMAPLFRSEYEKRGVSRAPYLFLKRHPVLCGLLAYRMNTQLQECGTMLCNAWGSVLYPAHLYNALRQSANLQPSWKDMEYIISLHSPSRLFVDAPPTEPNEYHKRFILALGASATNFARNRRPGGSSQIPENKKGPRGLKTTTPIKDIFHDRYVYDHPAKLSTANLTAMFPGACKAQRTSAPCADLQTLTNDFKPQPQSNTLHLLTIIREGVAAEELHLLFDYFGLHQRNWEMLQTLQTHLHADLVRYSGEGYLEQETQLPHVIAMLFEAVWGSDHRQGGGSRRGMLAAAVGVLERFLGEEGNSGKSLDAARAASSAVVVGRFGRG